MFSSFERFELELTLEQAQSASHQGQCDDDVEALACEPGVAAQLAALDPEKVRDELREYGAWDDDELADHAANLLRVLWLAAGQIRDENAQKGVNKMAHCLEREAKLLASPEWRYETAVRFAELDRAWQAEIDRKLPHVVNARYLPIGRGESGSDLRLLYDLREAARDDWERAHDLV